jgi:hypothetical protein
MARTFEVITPLGKDAQGQDVLRFRGMHGPEELGQLPEFDLSTVSQCQHPEGLSFAVSETAAPS